MTEEWMQSADAMVWAEQFVEHVNRKPSIATDVETMVGWFACSMQAALDAERWRREEAA